MEKSGATGPVLRFPQSSACLSLEVLGDRPRGLAVSPFAMGDARKAGYKTPPSALPWCSLWARLAAQDDLPFLKQLRKLMLLLPVFLPAPILCVFRARFSSLLFAWLPWSPRQPHQVPAAFTPSSLLPTAFSILLLSLRDLRQRGRLFLLFKINLIWTNLGVIFLSPLSTGQKPLRFPPRCPHHAWNMHRTLEPNCWVQIWALPFISSVTLGSC